MAYATIDSVLALIWITIWIQEFLKFIHLRQVLEQTAQSGPQR